MAAVAVLLTVLGLAALVVDKAGRLVRWDARALERDRIDYSWELDLMLLAEDGRWSGVDFQSPRGPLFQLLCWLPSALFPGDVGWRLLGAEALFEMVCLLGAVGLALLFVRGPPRRLIAAALLATLAFGAGIETSRALASVLVVLLYGALDARWRRRPWRGAFLVAGAVALAASLSFERWALGWLAIGVMHVVDVVGRRIRGVDGRPAWRKLGRVAAAQLAVLAALAVVLFAAGGSPVDYVAGAWRTGVVYAAGRSVPWIARAVSPTMVAAFVVASLALAARWAIGVPGRRREAQWIAGAATFGVFAVFRPYPGQIFVGLAPLAMALSIVAAARIPLRSTRPRPEVAACATLALGFVIGWFVIYPGNLWWNPASVAVAIEGLTEEAPSDRPYATELSQAADWLEAHDAEACFGTYAGGHALYAMVGGDGPNRGRMRWAEGPAAIAEAIRERACPYHLQFLYSVDRTRVAGLAFGEDFLTLAERYRALERIAPSLWVFEARDRPIPAQRREVQLTGAPEQRSVALGEVVSMTLSEPIEGHEILALRYRLEPESWLPPPIVNVPRIQVRFTLDGEPVGEWQPVYERRFGEHARLLTSPDPEAAERRFLLEEPLYRRVRADGVELRLEGFGWRAARGARLTIGRGRILTHPRVRPDRRWTCDRRRDLVEDVITGEALIRNVAPRLGDDEGFDLEANPPLEPPPEVMFPVAPCPGTCFEVDLAVDLRDEGAVGDGVGFEVHVIDREQRTLIHSEPMRPGESGHRSFPLDQWVSRPILLRLATTSGADVEGDFARVRAPRLAPCAPVEDPFVDPAVLPRAATFAEDGLVSEAGVAAEWARERIGGDPDRCVALRPALDDLGRVHELVEGYDAVAWRREGISFVGGQRAMGCADLLYRIGAFDRPARALAQMNHYWRVLLSYYEPVTSLGPTLWHLRLRDDPPRLEPRRVPFSVEGGALRLSEPLPAERLLELTYTLACEGERPQTLALELRGAGERLLGLESPVAIDHLGLGSVRVSAHPETLERRWVSWGQLGGSALEEVRPSVPSGCELLWRGAEVVDPPGAPRDAPACVEERDLLTGTVWPRHTRAERRGSALALRTTDGDGGLPEVFFPGTICPGTCLLLEVRAEGPDGTVGVEVHRIDGADRARLWSEPLAVGDSARTSLPLSASRTGVSMLRVGLTPRTGAPAELLVERAQIGPCEASP